MKQTYQATKDKMSVAVPYDSDINIISIISLFVFLLLNSFYVYFHGPFSLTLSREKEANMLKDQIESLRISIEKETEEARSLEEKAL